MLPSNRQGLKRHRIAHFVELVERTVLGLVGVEQAVAK
jgi:hypothetical protein